MPSLTCTNHFFSFRDVVAVTRAASALHKSGDKLPEARRVELLKVGYLAETELIRGCNNEHVGSISR